MRKFATTGRLALVALLFVSLVALTGCSYVKYRVSDAVDMFDIGLTFTKTPQFSAYINCPTVIPIGFGKVDGYFWGMAEGRTGLLRHQREEEGFLFWGREKMSFRTFDEANDAETLAVEDVGLVGLAANTKHAKKRPMCIHHLHLGWIGVVGNIRYQEIGDFALGFAGIDYMQDDGPNGGWWFRRKVPTTDETLVASDNSAGVQNTPTQAPLAETGFAKFLPVDGSDGG